MSKQKMTPWYPADVKPVRKGAYQTRMHHDDDPTLDLFDKGFAFWNGKFWSNQTRDADAASNFENGRGYQNKVWRGLAEKP